MRVLFIASKKNSFSAKKPLSGQKEMHFGISYISSFLKNNGHETKLLVLTKKTGSAVIVNALKTFSPSLICFTFVFSEYKFISASAKYFKEQWPEIFLLAGGPHVSLNPEECIKDSFDALCVGEGEDAVLELVTQLESGTKPSKIPNLWIKTGGAIEKNPPRPFLPNLDRLPFPDRAMWQEWIQEPDSVFPLLLGRGCPFLCTYCCNHALRKLADGEYVRQRSTANIMAEIKEILADYPKAREIYFEIESFGVNKAWAVELCSKLKELNSRLSPPLSFAVNLRITPNLELEELFSKMKEAGFEFVNIGLESGSERVRKEILKRDYSNGDFLKIVNLARKKGLKIVLYVLIGIPGETLEDFKETIKLSRSCLPDYADLSIFFPYPGTELYLSAQDKGLLQGDLNTERERVLAVLDLPNFTKKQITSNYVWFGYNVYQGYKAGYKLLLITLRNKINSTPWLYSIFSGVISYLPWIYNALKRLSK